MLSLGIQDQPQLSISMVYFQRQLSKTPQASTWLLIPFERAQLWAIYARVNRRPVFIARTWIWPGKPWAGEKTGCSPPKALGIEWLTIKLRLVWMCTPEYRKVPNIHYIFTASALIPVRALPFHFHWEPDTCKELRNLFLNFHQTFAVCSSYNL